MDRKLRKREYLESPPNMGVFKIEHIESGKVFVASGRNLRGIMNSHRFQLKSGTHKNYALQTDWNQFGEGAFEIEILEDFPPPDLDTAGLNSELLVFEDLWIEKLGATAPKGYNERRISRAERIKRISDDRKRRYENPKV
ncbi:MAG: GIY-YIG nuclease family protein [Pyrinomonadaceae bacterium]